MGTRTPKIHRLQIDLAPGASRVYKDNDMGVQRAIYIPQGIMDKNPVLLFGPTGVPFQMGTTVGIFIQFDDDFDELTITVPASASGNATGDILMSGCANFVVQGI